MAKQLGQIHTVNYTLGLNNSPIGLNPGDQFGIDLAGQLTSQLQHMVRCGGNTFKLVGIDMGLRNITGSLTLEPTPIAGNIHYYAPTKGRCEAIKECWTAIKTAMKTQGIDYHTNRQYDFRPIITKPIDLVNGDDFMNLATFDGSNALTLDSSGTNSKDRIFDVYNSNIRPYEPTSTATFSTGFGLPGTGHTATDFVDNEGRYYEASLSPFAAGAKESIPFQLAYGSDSTAETSAAVLFEWRPDPALYLSILTGQLIVDLETMPYATLSNYVLDCAFHVAGWKSIMGSHQKSKRRHSKRRKSHGRKRRSKK